MYSARPKSRQLTALGKGGEALILPQSAWGPVTISLGWSCNGRAQAAHCPSAPWLCINNTVPHFLGVPHSVALGIPAPGPDSKSLVN